MEWAVDTSDAFETWFDGLGDDVQRRLTPKIDRLVLYGPMLGFPESSDIVGSRHGGMRELRIQVNARPYRILNAFDPGRHALLLLGGDKGGDDAWYTVHVPLADVIFDRHLGALVEVRAEEAKQAKLEAERIGNKGAKRSGDVRRKKRG